MASTLFVVFIISIIGQSNAQYVSCFGGSCFCPSATSGTTCILNCNGKDACKDSMLRCRAGDPCEVHCYGEDACSGNTIIDGSAASDVTIRCPGKDGCKGNSVMRCGSGNCIVGCGQSASCEGATIYSGMAQSFECQGYCPSGTYPFQRPTSKPTPAPTNQAPTTARPTDDPTPSPTPAPTNNPTPSPTALPSKSPTPSPTNVPTASPTPKPSKSPTPAPDSSDITATNAPLISNNGAPNNASVTTATANMDSVGLVIIAVLCIGLCLVMTAIGWILWGRWKRAQQLKAFGHTERSSSYAFKPSAFKDVKYEIADMEMERVMSGSASNAHNIADANSMALKSPHSLTHMSSKYIGSPMAQQMQLSIQHPHDIVDDDDNKSTVSDIDNAQNQIIYEIDGVKETGNDYDIFLQMLQKNKEQQQLVPHPHPLRPLPPQAPVALPHMQPQGPHGYGMPQPLPHSYYPHVQPQPQLQLQRGQTGSFGVPRPAFYVPMSTSAPQMPQQNHLRVINQNERMNSNMIEEEEMECLKPKAMSENENEEVKEMEKDWDGYHKDTNDGGAHDGNDVEDGWAVSHNKANNDDVKSELSDCTESTAWNTNR